MRLFWSFVTGCGVALGASQCSGASPSVFAPDASAGDHGSGASGGSSGSGYGQDAVGDDGGDGSSSSGSSSGSGASSSSGGAADAGASCKKLGACCNAVLMISPTANVQSCLQTAQAGNESLCAGYYNLLSSTGVAALCP